MTRTYLPDVSRLGNDSDTLFSYAIVISTIKDYEKAVKEWVKTGSEKALWQLRREEKFIRSDWFQILTANMFSAEIVLGLLQKIKKDCSEVAL